jgi:hypothetical protein
MSKWQILRSSNIKACRYDRSMQLLFIEFTSGSVYVFWQIPWSIYMQFRRAKSHGSFFTWNIRTNPDYGYRHLHPEAVKQFESGDVAGLLHP